MSYIPLRNNILIKRVNKPKNVKLFQTLKNEWFLRVEDHGLLSGKNIILKKIKSLTQFSS